MAWTYQKEKWIGFFFLLRISSKYIFTKKKTFFIVSVKIIDKIYAIYCFIVRPTYETSRTFDMNCCNFRILGFFLKIRVRNIRSSVNSSHCHQIEQDKHLSSWVNVLGSVLFTRVQLYVEISKHMKTASRSMVTAAF